MNGHQEDEITDNKKVLVEKCNSKVKLFNLANGIFEIRYYDVSNYHNYRSWQIPRVVVDEVILWRKK